VRPGNVVTSPFHEGEQRVQARLGVRDEIEPWAQKVVRDHLPDEHRRFYGRLPFVVVAARDGRGRPWATLLADRPGFVRSPNPTTLVIEARPPSGDALEDALGPGADVGFLGIELATRRRNRVNGRISATSSGGFEVTVDQTFGNCPQYIHERDWREGDAARTPRRRLHDSLPQRLRSSIEGADTFFIATGHRGEGDRPSFGMDASHRGGDPGFVRVTSERSLMFPDYAGNNHFNTIGNLLLDPRAGLVFVDFERGSLLQLTGRVEIDWDSPEVGRIQGARRLVHFEIDQVVELESALPLRFDAVRGSVRSLRVVEKIRESDEVTSFVFEARDGGPLPDFTAGQHLPLEVKGPEGCGASRTYSLSNGSGEGRYRISVKRHTKGLISRCLHDHIEVGSIIDARTPKGDFVLDPLSTRPVVLASAGVGLTPVVSMLHELVGRGDTRNIWFVHGARDGTHHPLADEVRGLEERGANVTLHVAYSRPRDVDRLGNDYHSVGRVDAALLEQLVPALQADFYLCGPTAFMAGLQDGLEKRGLASDRIRFETF